MRSSNLSSPVILLLLLVAAMEAEAIRLDVQTRASIVRIDQTLPTDVNKPSVDLAVHGSSSTAASSGAVGENTKRSVAIASGEVRAVAHKLPEFHEDYYGASDHSPRHH